MVPYFVIGNVYMGSDLCLTPKNKYFPQPVLHPTFFLGGGGGGEGRGALRYRTLSPILKSVENYFHIFFR